MKSGQALGGKPPITLLLGADIGRLGTQESRRVCSSG